MNVEQVADIRRRDAELRAWMGKRNSYHSDELPAHIKPPTNEERSAAEIFEFQRDRPDRYFLYVKMTGGTDTFACTVTTWMGDRLGAGRCGFVYRSNLGDKRRPIRFQAITGYTYARTCYCGAGDYARVRKLKN
jgi:hypothetical protein